MFSQLFFNGNISVQTRWACFIQIITFPHPSLLNRAKNPISQNSWKAEFWFLFLHSDLITARSLDQEIAQTDSPCSVQVRVHGCKVKHLDINGSMRESKDKDAAEQQKKNLWIISKTYYFLLHPGPLCDVTPPPPPEACLAVDSLILTSGVIIIRNMANSDFDWLGECLMKTSKCMKNAHFRK